MVRLLTPISGLLHVFNSYAEYPSQIREGLATSMYVCAKYGSTFQPQVKF